MSTRQKKVSIVIVSRDFKDYLANCIKNIDTNTDRDFIETIVVIDNGSEDMFSKEEFNKLTSFPISLIRTDNNFSFSHANNIGAESTGAFYVCFMNNDIEVCKGWLSPLYETIDNNARVGAVGPKMIFPDGSIQFAGYEHSPETNFQKHKFRNAKFNHLIPEANITGAVSSLSGACFIVRKEDAHFDEQYWYGCEDVDLCVQLKQKNKIIFYQPQSVVVHHEEITRSSGRTDINYEKNRVLFKSKWGSNWEKLLWEVVT